MRKKESVVLSEEHFEIKKSTVANIGKGLFTKVNIPKETTIGYYAGKVLTDEEVEEEPYISSVYLLWVCKDHWIYGEGEFANYTRYINHSDRPNLELITSFRWKTARFQTLRKIKAGEELFFDYGKDYWEAMECRPK
jgi:SET domain-containing protein